jgi:transposase
LSVYTPVAVGASGCASPGCRCHGRKPSYPSDLSDAEWAVLEGEARTVMAELVAVTGRPMVHDLRATLDAINYVTRYGIEWRALPVDFPPHAAVYAFFLRWSRRGLPERRPSPERVLSPKVALYSQLTGLACPRPAARSVRSISRRRMAHVEHRLWNDLRNASGRQCPRSPRTENGRTSVFQFQGNGTTP